jgi:hyperosmotically inducible periplasmic protein
MSYDEQESKKSRVVVETPGARREVTQTERQYLPERNGVSSGLVAVLAILVVAVVVLLILLFMNMQNNANNNANLAAQQPSPAPQTTIVQQPAQQPPIIVQQPAPATQPPPVIVNPATPNGGTAATVPNDETIQAAIDKKMQGDPMFAALDVTATVNNGKVTLVGSVKSEQMKDRIVRLVRSVKGVKSVDNQIVVVTR